MFSASPLDQSVIDKVCQPGLRVVLAACLLTTNFSLFAGSSEYILPPVDSALIGEERIIIARDGESLVDIAERYSLGQLAVQMANTNLYRHLPVSGERVRLPTRHILPATQRTGIVVNLPELRLYDYTARELPRRDANDLRSSTSRVVTYPVSVGRIGWATPRGPAMIINRRTNPTWIPPASIRQEAAARGIDLPDRVHAGPNNPLGKHALYLDLPGYLLHGTNDTRTLGMRVTHGCVRLYPKAIADLHRRVPIGTEVHFVDESVKVGWYVDQLWIEVHPPLAENATSDDRLLDDARRLVASARAERPDYRILSSLIRRAVERRDGVLVMIGRLSPVQ